MLIFGSSLAFGALTLLPFSEKVDCCSCFLVWLLLKWGPLIIWYKSISLQADWRGSSLEWSWLTRMREIWKKNVDIFPIQRSQKKGNNHVTGLVSLPISWTVFNLLCQDSVDPGQPRIVWILKPSSRSKSCLRHDQLFPVASTRWLSVLLCVRHSLFDPTVYHKVLAASLEKSPLCSRWACPNSSACSPI